MIDSEEVIVEFPSIKKEFNEFQIELITNINSSLTIIIRKKMIYIIMNQLLLNITFKKNLILMIKLIIFFILYVNLLKIMK